MQYEEDNDGDWKGGLLHSQDSIATAVVTDDKFLILTKNGDCLECQGLYTAF